MKRLLALLLFATTAQVLFATTAQAATHDLVIERRTLQVEPGRNATVIAINGSVPGPVLRFHEGETETVRVTNRLAETTSIHWHGLLVPGPKDGAPGFNAFAGIKPGETFTYTFPIRQNGTYWYHAHSATQEQAGQYGAMIIDPRGADSIKADREHIVLISEHTRENPERILRNLKADSDYYNWNRRTLPQMLADARKFGLGKTLADRAAWGRMRMDPTDIADVSGYHLLINGQTAERKPWLEARPGERVRLRLINGTAMSLVDVRIPGMALTIVAADGRRVQPVTVDEFRMGVAETYDIIVEPKTTAPLALWIETIDRRANILATLGPSPDQVAVAPPSRPKQILLASEMGHDMAAMQASPAHEPATSPGCAPEHAAMGHCVPATSPPPAAAVPATDPDCPPEHAAMGHCTPKAASPPTPYPRIDYGFGNDPMAGMNHAPALAREGDTDASGRVFGWATGAPWGARVLSIRDLASADLQPDVRPPTREIIIKVSGNMQRYIWTLNGAKFGDSPPIRVANNERVRITFVNESMMAHPMHLHGMFFQVENGQPMDRLPDKNVIVVAPGRTQSILLTANEAGEWPLHCHLLYHMESGMMQKLIVASVDNPDGTPASLQHVH